MSRNSLLKIVSTFVLLAMPIALRASGTLSVYVSPPSAQSTTVTGVSTETFDDLSTGVKTSSYVSTIGTYVASQTSPFAVLAHDIYGGGTDASHSSPTNYFALGNATNSTNAVYLTLSQPAAYFGFWWSAGDQYNRIALYQGNTLYATFSTQDLLSFLNNGTGTITATNLAQYQTSAYFGNPNIASGSRNATEPYVYVSFKITGATIDKLAFYNTSTQSAFESDNHSVVFGTSVSIPDTFVKVEDIILNPTVEVPTFSPVAGVFTSPQTVTLATTTANAMIRYTTDGSNPTSATGTVYTAPHDDVYV